MGYEMVMRLVQEDITQHNVSINITGLHDDHK